MSTPSPRENKVGEQGYANMGSLMGIVPRKKKNKQKKKEQEIAAVMYTDTKTLLGFIEQGRLEDFRAARKQINSENLFKLAKAIVTRYDPEEEEEGLGDEEGDEDVQKATFESLDGNQDDEDGHKTVLPTPPRSPSSHQTQEDWLKLLLDTFQPDVKTRRALAEELIQKIGQDEMRQGFSEKQSPASQDSPVCRLFTCVIEDETIDLLNTKDIMDQTLFHVAAIHGALNAINICLSVYDLSKCCKGGNAHAPGCKFVKHLLLTSVDKAESSPLGHATTKSHLSVVSGMLDLLGRTDDTEPRVIRELLIKATTSTSGGNNVGIMRELLTVRPVGIERKFRTDVVDEDLLQRAAKHFNFEVFKFLLSVGSTILSSPDCSLIHYVVFIDQIEAAKYLLKNFPHLATTFYVDSGREARPGSNTTLGERRLSVLAPGPASTPEVDEEKLSVLALYKGQDTELRDLIFETLMEQLPISELREHLGGQTWTGKEISLDVTILAFDPLSLAAFLGSVRGDIEKLDEYVRDPLGQSADNADEELVQFIRLADIPYRYFPRINSVGIEFERILKYVNIPFFGGELREKKIEAVSILHWLRVCKGVKRVFELTVDDCRYCPTTEEDIEMAIRHLDVQHLDWRRTDLSITAIASIAKHFKTLHLYSSGNLATIDHWLGPKGINTLNLDWLYIHVIQDDFVSRYRATLCRDLCQNAKLNVKNKPVVTIDTVWNPAPAGRRHHTSVGSVRKQSPIEVTGIAHFIRSYTEARSEQLDLAVHKLQVSLPKALSDTRTKVAILDSGVNGHRFPLQDHARQGRSFVWRDNGKGHTVHQSETSWWLAVDPHGSQMANIISQLDPYCVFYFVQIADNMNYIELPTVIKALDWAIKCNVDIINCSFALDKGSNELEAVLLKAKLKRILIMCSTADEGQNIDEVWPASYYQRDKGKTEKFEHIFPIVGCDENGKFSKYANEEAGRYMFRGEDVDVSSTDRTLLKETENVQGSSVATAIASGIASLILACYRMIRVQDASLLQYRDSLPWDLVDAYFTKMSEKKSNNPDHPRLLVKASNFFPVGKDDIPDPQAFFSTMAEYFNEIS